MINISRPADAYMRHLNWSGLVVIYKNAPKCHLQNYSLFRLNALIYNINVYRHIWIYPDGTYKWLKPVVHWHLQMLLLQWCHETNKSCTKRLKSDRTKLISPFIVDINDAYNSLVLPLQVATLRWFLTHQGFTEVLNYIFYTRMMAYVGSWTKTNYFKTENHYRRNWDKSLQNKKSSIPYNLFIHLIGVLPVS